MLFQGSFQGQVNINITHVYLNIYYNFYLIHCFLIFQIFQHMYLTYMKRTHCVQKLFNRNYYTNHYHDIKHKLFSNQCNILRTLILNYNEINKQNQEKNLQFNLFQKCMKLKILQTYYIFILFIHFYDRLRIKFLSNILQQLTRFP